MNGKKKKIHNIISRELTVDDNASQAINGSFQKALLVD